LHGVVGVGHICQDHLCIVEDYPPEDGSTRITDIHIQGGGAVATAIVAAARLGVASALIGNVGTDAIGDEIVAELAMECVDVSGIDRLAGVRSLSSYVMIQTERGTRTKFPVKDRLPPIAWVERQRTMLRNAKILHLDGTHYENARRAAELAKADGVTVSLDGCTRQKDNRLNRELASLADILITNAAYPIPVSGQPTMHAALLEMSTWGPCIVIATFGSEGVLAVIDGVVHQFPAFPVTVVDSTGAGDVFHGAFLAARLRGMGLEDCIRFAQYAAGRKCEQLGGRRGIPDWATVEGALSKARRSLPSQANHKEERQ
jgi:sulfofructose kinase